jgi:protein required for attachment to host cells
MELRHDLKKMEEETFGLELVNMLQRSLSEMAFDKLVLFAPHKMLSTIRRHANSNLRQRISADAPKELLKLPLQEVRKHIRSLSSQSQLDDNA